MDSIELKKLNLNCVCVLRDGREVRCWFLQTTQSYVLTHLNYKQQNTHCMHINLCKKTNSELIILGTLLRCWAAVFSLSIRIPSLLVGLAFNAEDAIFSCWNSVTVHFRTYSILFSPNATMKVAARSRQFMRFGRLLLISSTIVHHSLERALSIVPTTQSVCSSCWILTWSAWEPRNLTNA